ncbi:MAG: hypothetical protein KAS66_00270 [Candidatus Omnitrophica bacterium]|nr:hypothetical protein [Candidatus Omnitrophota bacterium]
MTTPGEARAKNRLEPVLLFDIELLNGGGTLCFSDRTITIGSTPYHHYILNASDVSDAVKRDTSTGDNPAVTIIFNNKSFRTYLHLSLIAATYPFSGGKVTIQEVYLDDDGNPSTAETLFVGRLEEIKAETIEQFTLVAMNIKESNSLQNTGRVN